MTDDVPDAARERLAEHGAFESGDDAYEVTTTPFDARVAVEAAEDEPFEAAVDVEVDVPTLDAVVADQTVGSAVEDDWLRTLELRLEDAYGVAEVEPLAEPTVLAEDDRVHTRFRFGAPDAAAAVDDAKAIVDFVEGTYVQGVIPGYEYDDPVAGLLARATETADGSADGAERGGTPL